MRHYPTPTAAARAPIPRHQMRPQTRRLPIRTLLDARLPQLFDRATHQAKMAVAAVVAPITMKMPVETGKSNS